MRLKTEIWVQALLRRCMASGIYGTVITRGAAEAGAVFVIINRQDGYYQLLGPAPGSTYDDDGERRFMSECDYPATIVDVEALLSRRRRFDGDLWVVEIEDRSGAAGLKIETI